MPFTIDDLYLAYRQAKVTMFHELRGAGMLEFAEYERRLNTRLLSLKKRLSKDAWFDSLELGNVWLTPKASDQPVDHGIRRVGTMPPQQTASALQVRVILAPAVDYLITEVLFLWRYGALLDGALGERSLGNRLDLRRGYLTKEQHHLFEFWPRRYREFKQAPVLAATEHLAAYADPGCLVISLDFTSFYDSIQPSFILSSGFVESLAIRAAELQQRFDTDSYHHATKSLLKSITRYWRATGELVGRTPTRGIPIGSITSRIIANLALQPLDQHIQSHPDLIHYSRYVDDITIVAQRSQPWGEARQVLNHWLPLRKSHSDRGAYRVDTSKLQRRGTVLQLQERKLSILELAGSEGCEFLRSVEYDARRVDSERRVFMDPSALRGEALAELARIDGERTSHVLRNSDRTRLANFELSLSLQALERVGMLVDRAEARKVVRRSLRPVITLLPTSPYWIERTDFIHRLLRIALLAGDDVSARAIVNYTDSCWRSPTALRARFPYLLWNRTKIRQSAFAQLRRYLDRRRAESVFASFPLANPLTDFELHMDERIVAFDEIAATARAFAAADVRTLDREDDASEVGNREETDHARLLKALIRNPDLKARFDELQRYVDRCRAMGDRPWVTSPVSLFACTRPPSYFDISRRLLYDRETKVDTMQIFDVLRRVVNAARGTQYELPIGEVISSNEISFNVAYSHSAPSCRLILGNLLTKENWHRLDDTSPTKIRSVHSLRRLSGLGEVLRKADVASRLTKGASNPPPSLLVLPELSLPRRWVRAVARYLSGSSNLSIVAGMEYAHEVSRGLLHNQVIAIMNAPYQAMGTWTWTKQNPSDREAREMKPLGLRFPGVVADRPRTVASTPFGRVSVLICSEIIEARLLSQLVGRVDMVLVPSWNTDTASFDHLMQSAGLQMHCVVALANNAEYSDCRAWAPYTERWQRDLARLITRRNNDVLWVDAPVAELRQAHVQGPGEIWRPLPPGMGVG